MVGGMFLYGCDHHSTAASKAAQPRPDTDTVDTEIQYYKVRPLRAAARCIPERGGAGHGTVVEKRAVHGQH